METTMNENLKETDVKIETASEDDAKNFSIFMHHTFWKPQLLLNIRFLL